MQYPKVLLGALLLSPISYAEIELNGFLSAIGGIATDDPVRGYDTDINFQQDTLFGLQASAEISDKLSMTAQLVSRGADDYATELSWGYLTYSVSSNLSMRIGRFRTPFYFYSDFREVGYAYPWVSPASEVYALPFDNIDGVDMLYTTQWLNGVSVDLQAYYGAVQDDFRLDNTGDVLDSQTTNHVGLSATFGYSDFSLRLSGHNADFTINDFNQAPIAASFDTLIESLEGLGEPAQGIITNLNVEDISSTFAQAGLRYDGEYIFAVVEGTNLSFDKGPIAEQKRMLASLGINIKNAVIYASYSQADDESVDLSGPLAPLKNQQPSTPEASPEIIEALTTNLDAISQALTINTETISFGIRYDFEPGAAFKIQYDSVTNTDPTAAKEEENGILRFGVDLVF